MSIAQHAPRPTEAHSALAVVRLLGWMVLGCLLTLTSQAQSRPTKATGFNTAAPVAASQPEIPAPSVAKSSGSKALKAQQGYEAQLSDIRQAILEATIDRPTRVLSSAWVDEKGALHESAHFTSEAQVRGVRVMSYVQGDEEPKTQVSAEVLPWGWNAKANPEAVCSAPPRAWRLPLMVQSGVSSGFTGRQLYASQSLLNSARQIWLQKMVDSQRWRTRQKELPPDSFYMRALTGPAEGSSGWAAELTLKPHAKAKATTWVKEVQKLALPQDEADWRWTLSLTLGQRHTPDGPMEVQWQAEQVVSISPEQIGRQPGAWLSEMQNALQLQMQRWVELLDKHFACEPIQFHVRREAGGNLQLQAGFESGLRAGDRVLLVNPAHVPSRMLEPDATQYMALAQVVRVGAERTELRQLAGPDLAQTGHWMALPL
jgi:hypothetical protein